jgi:urea transport system ATP-binding protein
MATLLYVDGLTVSFDGFLALRNLSFILEDQEKIRLLIGPNGAGKTTLFDALTGQVRPAAGQALFHDRIDLLVLREHEIANRGVIRKFQTPSVFPKHTVFDNLVLSAGRKGLRFTLAGRLPPAGQDRVAQVLEQVGLLQHASEPAGTLSHGQKQWLEMAMLLVQEPRLLLLDEPVAGMTHAEKEKTAALLEAIVEQPNRTIMLTEHDMEFVRQVGRHGYRVTVLHEGSVLSEGPLTSVQADERVIKAYLGRGEVGAGLSC